LPVRHCTGRSCGRGRSNKVSTMIISWDVESPLVLTTSHALQLWLQARSISMTSRLIAPFFVNSQYDKRVWAS
jgi:hypothetical protein